MSVCQTKALRDHKIRLVKLQRGKRRDKKGPSINRINKAEVSYLPCRRSRKGQLDRHNEKCPWASSPRFIPSSLLQGCFALILPHITSSEAMSLRRICSTLFSQIFLLIAHSCQHPRAVDAAFKDVTADLPHFDTSSSMPDTTSSR